jgi:Ca-activated chloride channel family protein
MKDRENEPRQNEAPQNGIADTGHLRYLLTAYLFENISQAGKREVEGHLAACSECREELEELRKTLGLVREAIAPGPEGGETYSFEARRLERVLVGSKRKSVWRRMEVRIAVAAAAVLLFVASTLIPTVLNRKRAHDGFYPLAAPSFYEVQKRGETENLSQAAPRLQDHSQAGDYRPYGRTPARDSALPAAQEPTALGSSADGDAGAKEVASETAEGLAYGDRAPGDLSRTRMTVEQLRREPPASREDQPQGTAPKEPETPFLAAKMEGDAASRSETAVGKEITLYGVDSSAGGKMPPVEEARAAGRIAPAPITAAPKDKEDSAADPAHAPAGLPPASKPARPAYKERAKIALGGAGRRVGGVAGPPATVEHLSEDSAPALQELESKTELDRNKLLKQVERREWAAGHGNLALNNAIEKKGSEPREFAKPDEKEKNVNIAVRDELRQIDGNASLDDSAKKASDDTISLWSLDTDMKVRVESRFLDEHQNFREEIDEDAPVVTIFYGKQVAPSPPPAAETRLRAYHYYRSLDPTLTPESFWERKLAVPPPAVGDEGLGQEGFKKRYGVSPFVDTRFDHLSTFGMDVDTASYTLARKMLQDGKLPDPKTVRVEEFINYFQEEYPPDPSAVFSVFCEGGPSPFGGGAAAALADTSGGEAHFGGLDLLKITVKARELHPGERKDAVLTFAVDTSGSMNLESRLGLVRQALTTLAGSLKPDDRVGIVGFAAHAYLVLPHTPAREKDRILGAISSLSPTGGTNVEAGLDLAYRIADEVFAPKAVNRIILCSDGVANVGARGPEEILKKVQVFAKRGIYLSCAGFGAGLKDALLETLADKGNGNYAYVDSAATAEKIFRDNLPSTLQVLAQDAKIQVDFNPEVVSHYRLLGYENRDIADKDFRNDKVDAGEVGPGTTVTVLYEIQRRANCQGDLGRIYLRYLDTGTHRVDEVSFPLHPGVLATSLNDSSDRVRFLACVAETAELLRTSYWARDGSYGKVLGVLSSLSPEYRARGDFMELAELVGRARELTIHNLAGK